MGVAMGRLKLGARWFDLAANNHSLCRPTGMVDRWECAAIADGLKKGIG